MDAVVGGGGLIQLPALFVLLPPAMAVNVAGVMGTNKFASICGTSMAAFHYGRRVKLNWKVLAPTLAGATVFSFIGARAVSLLNPAMIKPVILSLLIAVAFYTYSKKDFGNLEKARVSGPAAIWVALALGAAVGFYDGFFGPGTGSFLIFGFVGLFGFEFLLASACAKIVNLGTNFSAVGWFTFSGNVYFEYAIPMGLANVAGAVLGARMALLKGNAFVRRFFLGVVALLIARFAYELAKGS